MAYGAPVQYAMTDGYVPPSPYNIGGSAPAPDISLTPIKDASASTLGRKNTIAKRLPAMPSSDMGDLSYTDYAELAAAREAYAIGVAANERKVYERNSKKISKQKNDAAQKIAERKPNRRAAKNRSDYAAARERAITYRAAQYLTGPSAFPYLTHIR